MALISRATTGGRSVTTVAHAVAEWRFQSTASYEDPFAAVEADAIFTTAGGATWKVPLFWAGGADWGCASRPHGPASTVSAPNAATPMTPACTVVRESWW